MIIIKITDECSFITTAGDKDCLKKELLNKIPEQINNLLDTICSNDDEKFDFMRDLQVQIMKSTTFSKKDSEKAATDGIDYIIKMLEDNLHFLSFLKEDTSLTTKEFCQIIAQQLAISKFLLEIQK